MYVSELLSVFLSLSVCVLAIFVVLLLFLRLSFFFRFFFSVFCPFSVWYSIRKLLLLHGVWALGLALANSQTLDTIQTQSLIPQPYRYAVIALLWLFRVFHSKNGHIFNSRSSPNIFILFVSSLSLCLCLCCLLILFRFNREERQRWQLFSVCCVCERIYLLRTVLFHSPLHFSSLSSFLVVRCFRDSDTLDLAWLGLAWTVSVLWHWSLQFLLHLGNSWNCSNVFDSFTF